MVRLAAVCSTLVLAVLLILVSQTNRGTFDSYIRLQHPGSVSDKRKPVCPGPVLEPSERQEPWNKQFSKNLSLEVASKDADKVQCLLQVTMHFSSPHHTDMIPVSGL